MSPAHGGFASVGPLQVNVKEKETVNIPVWAGIFAVVAGGVLLFVRRT